MFKWVLVFKPQLDNGDLDKMDKSLTKRFTKIARGFGKGLSNIITKGSLLGLSFGLIQKLLNPLEDVEQRIKDLLAQSEDVQQTADNLDTSAGRLFKLRELGAATGLDAKSVDELISKFQETIVKAREENVKGGPQSPSSQLVKNFIGEKDIGESFFKFIQTLQSLDKSTRTSVEKEIFGSQQKGASARFINSDFKTLNANIGDKNASTFDTQFSRLSSLNQKSNALEASRNIDSFLQQASNVNEGMITSMDQAERLRLSMEARQLASYEDLKNASIVLGEVKEQIMGINTLVNKLIGMIPEAIGFLKSIANSPSIKGLLGYFSGGGK